MYLFHQRNFYGYLLKENLRHHLIKLKNLFEDRNFYIVLINWKS